MGCCSDKEKSFISSSERSNSSLLGKLDNQNACPYNEGEHSKNAFRFLLNLPLEHCNTFRRQSTDLSRHDLKAQELIVNMETLKILRIIIKDLLNIIKLSILDFNLDDISYNRNNFVQSSSAPILKQIKYPDSPQKTRNHNSSDQRNIIAASITTKYSHFINLKQAELKLELLRCELPSDSSKENADKETRDNESQLNFKDTNIDQYLEKQQSNCVGSNETRCLSISFFHKGREISCQTISLLKFDEGTIEMGDYMSFPFELRPIGLSENEFQKESYVVFEFKYDSTIIKKKIQIEEFYCQKMFLHKLRFFPEQLPSLKMQQTCQFELVIRIQLIHNPKMYLEELLRDSEVLLTALKADSKVYLKNKTRKSDIKYQTYQPIFTDFINNYNSNQNNHHYDNNEQTNDYIDRTFNRNSEMIVDTYSKLSLEYKESYSYQFNNDFAFKEEEDDQDDHDNHDEEDISEIILPLQTVYFEDVPALQPENQQSKRLKQKCISHIK